MYSLVLERNWICLSAVLDFAPALKSRLEVRVRWRLGVLLSNVRATAVTHRNGFGGYPAVFSQTGSETSRDHIGILREHGRLQVSTQALLMTCIVKRVASTKMVFPHQLKAWSLRFSEWVWARVPESSDCGLLLGIPPGVFAGGGCRTEGASAAYHGQGEPERSECHSWAGCARW